MRGATSFMVVALFVAACGGGASTTPSPTAPPATATVPPPSATAPAAQVMASGQLVDIDGTASGTAQLVAMGDVYEVVLEDFAIDSIEHTNVVLVSNAAVTMSDDVDATKFLDLGPLQATSGMQVYMIPAEMSASVMDGYHSVVIWDTAMAHAIATAALK